MIEVDLNLNFRLRYLGLNFAFQGCLFFKSEKVHKDENNIKK